MITVGNSLVIQ